MQIIAIANQKGGCGKTTTAINLSAALALNKKRILLIDLDPQAHASCGLSVTSEKTIYNVLSNIVSEKMKLADVIVNVKENFDLAPSGIVLSTLEQELSDEIGRESRVRDAITSLSKKYDYVIIDCPPNLGILTVNAIRAANRVIIPVEPSSFALHGVQRLIEIINLIKDRLNHNILEWRILVNNFDSRLQHSFKVLTRIKVFFKNKIFNTMIHINVKLKESQFSGCDIFRFDKYSRGAKDYGVFAKEIILAESQYEIQVRSQEILSQELPKFIDVAFKLNSPESKEVYIAGDFNNWTLDKNSRLEKKDGVWMKRIQLSKGMYRYRFVVDGNWVQDPNNTKVMKNPYGAMDSVVKID